MIRPTVSNNYSGVYMTILKKTHQLRIVENSSPQPNGCWIWTGYVLPDGYGQFSISVEDGWVRAHRASFSAFHGDIPAAAHVLHRCNNKVCVNPTHLYLGSDADNCADRVAAGTQGKTTPAQRIDIALSTLSTKELAAKYGLCEERIRVIKRRYRKGTLT